MKLFSKDALDNTIVKGLVVAKTVEVKPTSRGTNFLSLTLSDAEGEVSAKYWDADKLPAIPESGAILRIEGTLGSWNDIRQVTISKMEIVDIASLDDIALEALLPVCPIPGYVMLNELKSAVSRFSDKHLQVLINTVFKEEGEKFSTFYGAMRMHHAVRGGLIWHTLSMMRTADRICDVYSQLYDTYTINRDLVIAGIILHDICKMREYEENNLGVVTDITPEGQLLGHIAMGAMYVDEMCKKVGVPDNTRLALTHILLSHHGQPDYGSPKVPAFPEALIVSEVDMLDAKMNAMMAGLVDVEHGTLSDKCPALGGIRLYRL